MGDRRWFILRTLDHDLFPPSQKIWEGRIKGGWVRNYLPAAGSALFMFTKQYGVIFRLSNTAHKSIQ